MMETSVGWLESHVGMIAKPPESTGTGLASVSNGGGEMGLCCAPHVSDAMSQIQPTNSLFPTILPSSFPHNRARDADE